jgi:dethiobiotin synthetase
MKASYFITGTDTGVGKTLISCALLCQLARTGLSTVGMKPVAAGCIEHDLGHGSERINDDVLALNAASSVKAPPPLVNPYLLQEPVAPHIAAAEEQVEIDLALIGRAFVGLSRLADVVIVEGVGGFCVPLNEHQDSGNLAQMLGLPVILVVGMRLGCLNHALLTQEAIGARGLKLVGWIANCIEPAMPRLEANIESLAQRIHAPHLATIPYMTRPDATQLAFELELLVP